MTRALACGLIACALSGCGTTANLNFPDKLMTPGPPRMEVYGGVTNDIRWVKDLSQAGGVMPLVAAALVLDIPLSAVADTLTLPVTVWAAVDRAYTSEPPLSAEEKTYWRGFWGVQESRELPVERMP